MAMDNYKWILTGSRSLGSVSHLGLQGRWEMFLPPEDLHTFLLGQGLRVWRELYSTVGRMLAGSLLNMACSS